MQTNEEKQFRLNPQMWIMLAAVLLALAPLVILGIYAVQMAMAKPAAEPTTEELGTELLRKTLEDLAAERLSGDSLASDWLEIVQISSDPKKEQARIEDLAHDFEATALPSSDNAGSVRILVSLPRENAQAFFQKLGAGNDAIPLPKEHARIWVEIIVRGTESP